MPNAPDPARQIEFLQKAQRLLSEGEFVASYKFALIRAIADLAVSHGDDSGAPLELAVSSIAEQFIKLYWPHVRPFPGTDMEGQDLLKQNTGKQAAIINHLSHVHLVHDGSLSQLQRCAKDWGQVRGKVRQTIVKMPLWKLQRVGSKIDDFIYEQTGSAKSIVLRPGAAYCLRRFYGIVRDMVEARWIAYLRKTNAATIGESVDLHEFLFGSKRANLSALSSLLIEDQRGRCFYCDKPIRATPHVDHFIPWSKYPADLGHNFVLADARCNEAKSAALAAEEHLVRWQERNRARGPDLDKAFRDHNVPFDLDHTVSVTRWAYAQAAETGGLVWQAKRQFVLLSGEWRKILIESP